MVRISDPIRTEYGLNKYQTLHVWLIYWAPTYQIRQDVKIKNLADERSRPGADYFEK